MSDDDKNETETKSDTTPAPPSTSNGVETRDVVEEPDERPRCARCAMLMPFREHPAVPGHCVTCGHAVIVEGAIERFAAMATSIHVGLEQLASSPQGAAVLTQLAGAAPSPPPASSVDLLAELGDEAKRVDLVDVTNRFAVSVNRTDVVILASVDRTKLDEQAVLNLCAWMSVLADLTDGDLIAARRKVEAT